MHHKYIISASSVHRQCRPDQTRTDQIRPDHRRLPSRGPNSKTCVLVIIVQIIVRGQWQWYTIFLGWAFPDEFFYSSSRITQMIFLQGISFLPKFGSVLWMTGGILHPTNLNCPQMPNVFDCLFSFVFCLFDWFLCVFVCWFENNRWYFAPNQPQLSTNAKCFDFLYFLAFCVYLFIGLKTTGDIFHPTSIVPKYLNI